MSSVDNDSDVDVKMGLEIASAGHEEVDHCTGDQLADTEKVSLYFLSLLKMNSEHDDPHNCFVNISTIAITNTALMTQTRISVVIAI